MAEENFGMNLRRNGFQRFSAGNTGTQAGGWFGKEINSAPTLKV